MYELASVALAASVSGLILLATIAIVRFREERDEAKVRVQAERRARFVIGR